jgi:putative hydrolase of the HAD superfamily
MAYFRDSRIERLVAESDVIIFDLNGLILDDETLQLRATNAALHPYKITLDNTQWILRCVGRKPSEYIPILLSDIGCGHADVPEIVRVKDEYYKAYIAVEGRALVRRGVLQFMEHLSNASKKCGLATSTGAAGVSAVMDALNVGLSEYFDLIVCGDDVERAKPDPAIYLKVRQELGDDLSYLVFEDSDVGVSAARAAAMRCIAVPNYFTSGQNFSGAVLIIRDLDSDATIIHR